MKRRTEENVKKTSYQQDFYGFSIVQPYLFMLLNLFIVLVYILFKKIYVIKFQVSLVISMITRV